MIGRFVLGLLLCLLGLVAGLARWFDAFGDADRFDGGVLLVLALFGVGIYLVATATDAESRARRKEQR